MPVNFLTNEQKQQYGRYVTRPSQEQLNGYFYLDDSDKELISLRRNEHNRLGFAVQLCTVRFLGTFLEDLRETPQEVVQNLSNQLAITNPACFEQYCKGEQKWEHATEIRRRYGYQDFATWPVQFRLNRWLYALCWTGTDRPSILFDRATSWMIKHKVLL